MPVFVRHYCGIEFAAKTLLDQFPTKSIFNALESASLSAHLIEGAAPLFAWSPELRAGNLPHTLIDRLRAHVREDPNKENRERFAAAFPDE